MPITTIDQNDPYLQKYGGLTVSEDLAAQLAQMQQNGYMVGMDPFNGVQIPQAGDSLLDFTAQLTFAGQPQWAQDIASMNGIPARDFTALMQTVNDATAKGQPYVWDKLSGIGNYSAEHPAILYAPAAIAGIAGLFGAGASGAAAGASGATGAGTLGGTLGGTTGATFDALGNLLVTGAAPTFGAGAALGAGLGGASLAGLPAGYSGSPPPGPVDMTVTGTPPTGVGIGGVGSAAGAAAAADLWGGVPPAPVSNFPTDVPDVMTVTGTPPSGLGAPALTGIGLGGAAGVAALLGGGSGAAPVAQGPPEPSQGPPEQTGNGSGTAAGAGTGAGAAAGAGGAGLAGLGWPAWLTAALAGASALTGPDAITSSTSSAPPAFIAPYLSDAAGAAQRAYQGGNYIAPIQQAASDYGTNVLTGSYLNANPWLDATFNKAAGAVTNQVQSNFGTAGRNVRGPDAAGLATDKYSELAAQIYGGNYQAERDRMQQIIPQANQLGAATNPNNALDDYIARLRNIGGSYGTTSSSTPTSSDWLGGLAGLGLLLAGGH